MHQRTFLTISILVAVLLLALLRPALAAHPAGGGLRFGGLYVLWLPEQEPGTAQAIDGLWLARQWGGDFLAFLDQEPYGGQTLWEQSAYAFQAQTSHESYSLDGHCSRGDCAGDLCRLALQQGPGGLLLVWSRRYVSGVCPAGAA